MTTPTKTARDPILDGIYAGCDVDLRVKLFRVVHDKPVPIELDDEWLRILDALGAEPGEMLLVSLEREPRPLADRTEKDLQRDGGDMCLKELKLRKEMQDAGKCDFCFREVGSLPVCEFPVRHAGP